MNRNPLGSLTPFGSTVVEINLEIYLAIYSGRQLRLFSASLIGVLLMCGSALAGLADVVSATADCAASVCSFTVTVRHDDAGWNHYADVWEVLAPDGTVIATRVLRHPHVEEQPFTRTLRGAKIPPGLRKVRIRARDSVHGVGGREIEILLSEE